MFLTAVSSNEKQIHVYDRQGKHLRSIVTDVSIQSLARAPSGNLFVAKPFFLNFRSTAPGLIMIDNDGKVIQTVLEGFVKDLIQINGTRYGRFQNKEILAFIFNKVQHKWDSKNIFRMKKGDYFSRFFIRNTMVYNYVLFRF